LQGADGPLDLLNFRCVGGRIFLDYRNGTDHGLKVRDCLGVGLLDLPNCVLDYVDHLLQVGELLLDLRLEHSSLWLLHPLRGRARLRIHAGLQVLGELHSQVRGAALEVGREACHPLLGPLDDPAQLDLAQLPRPPLAPEFRDELLLAGKERGLAGLVALPLL